MTYLRNFTLKHIERKHAYSYSTSPVLMMKSMSPVMMKSMSPVLMMKSMSPVLECEMYVWSFSWSGRERLSGILGVSSEQASRFQDSFLQTYREVQTFIQTTVQQCHRQGE